MYSKAREILRQVSREYMIPIPEVLSKRRRKWQVVARHEAMRRMRDDLNMSFPEIAFVLKRFDHTTVMHGVKRARQRLKEKKKRGLDK